MTWRTQIGGELVIIQSHIAAYNKLCVHGFDLKCNSELFSKNNIKENPKKLQKVRFF